jgi:hypothetical protein
MSSCASFDLRCQFRASFVSLWIVTAPVTVALWIRLKSHGKLIV